MEAIIVIVGMILCAIFFKSSIKKGNQYLSEVIDANIAEEQADLIERSMNAYEEVLDRCGPDFKTPEEVLSLLRKKNRRGRNKGQNQQN